jgi:phage shock protein A
MKARAGAIDELMASGALEDAVSGPRDDIQAELDRIGATTGVDSELERMKLELSQGSTPELEAGTGAEPAHVAEQQRAGDTQ